MGPLIPFIKIPELPLSFVTHIPVLSRYFDPRHPPTIKPFGTLVALGVYIGSVVAMRHGRERKIDEKKLSEFIFYVVGIGFVGGHMLDAIFYHPAHLAKDPLYLFMLWEGLSSYGGFIGAVMGALIFKCVEATWHPIKFRGETLFSVPKKIKVSWREGQKILPMCEVINSAFPLAWVFGRSGCSSVHDHPGMLSDAWFAVRWEVSPTVWVGRLDLGLIEMVLTIPLAVGFLIAWRRKPFRPLGFYTGWMCVAYAPVRFLLDFLRVGENERGLNMGEGDPRYGGLTPAQWACFGLLALGIYFLRKAYSKDAPSTEPKADEKESVEEESADKEAPASNEAPASER